MLNIVVLSIAQFVTLLVVYAIVKQIRPSAQWWSAFSKLGRNNITAILICGGVTLVLSVGISLIRWPVPSVHDEFSYLLAADTFASQRLSNPTHPLWQHFETFHVIHQPTYASKYPPAQGLLLAVGQRLGHPVVGIWIGNTLAVMCSCWMMQAWLPGRWALLGGLLVAFHPTVQLIWGQGFMGPAAAIAGGALVLGAFPRIGNKPRPVTALVLAIGLTLLANSRPFEGLVLSLPVAVSLLMGWFRSGARNWLKVVGNVVVPVVAVLTVAAAAMGYYNRVVTHDAVKMPYQVHEETYGVSPLFIWKPLRRSPEFRHTVMRDFQLGWALDAYRKQSDPAGFVAMKSDMVMRVWYYIVGPALTVPLVFCFPSMRQRRFAFLLSVILLVLFAAVLVPWTMPHYLGPALPAVLVLLILGLRHLRTWKREGRPVGRFLFCAILFAYLLVFFVGAAWHVYAGGNGWQYDRARIVDQLGQSSGRHLVVVRYRPTHHPISEWVYNDADIDSAKIVWAREMGPNDNIRLLEYFHDRRIWFLDADVRTPQLVEHLTPSREGNK